MSLTSRELNYLIWRYFQEAGYDLSAFTFDRQSQCSKYEHAENEKIIEKIEPGCLVDLVQKGILYTIADSDSKGDSDYSLLGALVQQEITNLSDTNFSKAKCQKRFQLKTEAENGKQEDDMELDNSTESIKFETKETSPESNFPSSLTCDWHPTSEVLAYGKPNGSAIINAIIDGKFVESVEISHPDLLNVKNEINIVSWSPLGNLLLTTGAFSEIRAWSPDGRLKNIANTVFEDINAESEIKQSLITSVLWNKSGKFVITIDSVNRTTLWDGVTLSLVRQIQTEEQTDTAIQTACWLGEDKFALTTATQGIKIYDITQPHLGVNSFEVQSIGNLPGHQNHISLIKLNDFSKLLATCSDFDYEIKVWSSSSTHTSLDLNVKSEKNQGLKLHASPIIGLHWIPSTEKSILISLSMEGNFNIWDAESGDNIKSSELFKNAENFSSELRHHVSKEVLLFNSVLSPNGKLLAIGDDYGKISVWDVNIDGYTSEDKSFVKCVTLYTPEIPQVEGKEATIGLCDLHWDHESKKLAASYIGIESVIISVV
ncbi:hypothetical protein CANMA_002342 [Candida margitis]|uniref:uncharacterized protein n=1 Tax=Candida margitis TaxID=1775924 RepID=UPI002226BFFC|nr:uncharacterized protein CANMA_002342 [Candida margitis]KAI5968597.1 hypothetical protein CANMA_002342 [Candida margitis]